MKGDACKPRVLVVDDTAEIAELARLTLEGDGMEVVTASRGEEGLRSFAAQQPDCVLLDVRMPDIGGFVVCERMRTLPGGTNVPIVFLTALRDVDTFDQAMRAGADDFLVKPVRPTELLVRVRAALKLRRMGRELGDLYEGIRRQRDDLMRLQLQKERFIAFLVHDFKNPVNSMELRTQLLLRDRGISHDTREGIVQIRADVRNLMRLILNVLDVSKGEESALRPERKLLKLGEVFTRVFQSLEMIARDAGVSFEGREPDLELSADRDMLERMLENLVENAVRHAPRESIVSLSAHQGDGFIDIRVRDRGAGVPPELVEQLFDAFVRGERRADGVSDSRTGRGLGLAFCRVAVEAHGGRIWLENVSPGAEFHLRFPNA